MTLQYGLSDSVIDQLRGAIAAQPHVRRVDLYGSRARGDFRPSSDIDLAVYGDEDFTFRDYLDLTGRIGDLPIIFRIDVVNMNSLDKPSLRGAITSDAVKFWEAQRKEDKKC